MSGGTLVAEGGATSLLPRCEFARAKVNLTLDIKGRRAGGYHELESLVLFADFGDRLVYLGGEGGFSLEVDGPLAGACSAFAATNLIRTAAEAFAGLTGRTPRGTFRLTKNIPIAAGLGGGSADAAATLRLLAAAHAEPSDLAALAPIARKIGADVPVCLASRAALMTGIGEKLHPLSAVEPVPAVLVNPMLPLATRDVFRELKAAPLPAASEPPVLPVFRDHDGLLAYANERANDLEAPARRLLPVIGNILGELERAPGARLARLSGSGPTCFALFATGAEAQAAAATLARAHPGWWVEATRLS